MYHIGAGKIKNKIVIEVIVENFVKNKGDKKTYFLKDEEAYIVSKSEIDGAHGLPRDIVSLTNDNNNCYMT